MLREVAESGGGGGGEVAKERRGDKERVAGGRWGGGHRQRRWWKRPGGGGGGGCQRDEWRSFTEQPNASVLKFPTSHWAFKTKLFELHCWLWEFRDVLPAGPVQCYRILVKACVLCVR